MSDANVDGANAWRRTRRCASRAADRPARAAVAASVRPCGIAAAASPAARIEETRSASSSSGDVPGGHGSSTRRSSTPARLAVAGERLDARRVQLGEPRDESPDRVAVRAVTRLTDGRIPAAREPLAGPLPERLAEQLVEERAEHELRPVRLDRVAHARTGGGRWIEPCVDRRPPSRRARPPPPAAGTGRSSRRRRSAPAPRTRAGRSRQARARRPGPGTGRASRPDRPVADGRAAPVELRGAGRGRRCRGRSGGRPRSWS